MNTLQEFKKILPIRITVNVEKNEDGSLWAKVKEIPHCYTQASSTTELTDMLNDAIFTHFEVPDEMRADLGFYVPLSEGHVKLEEMFRNMISIEKRISAGSEAQETFSLRESQLC